MAEVTAQGAWPALREDLTLHPGAPAVDGSYTWSLQDPARNLFFRVDWTTFEILSRWHLSDASTIVDGIAVDTPLQLDEDDVTGVLQFLRDNQLLALASQRDTDLLLKRRNLAEHGWIHLHMDCCCTGGIDIGTGNQFD